MLLRLGAILRSVFQKPSRELQISLVEKIGLNLLSQCFLKDILRESQLLFRLCHHQ